jgi:hypothetical protein
MPGLCIVTGEGFIPLQLAFFIVRFGTWPISTLHGHLLFLDEAPGK